MTVAKRKKVTFFRSFVCSLLLFSISLLSNVFCPVCQHTFKEFLICGRGEPRKGLCPCCFSKARARHIFLFLNEHKGLIKDDTVLLHWAPIDCLRILFERSLKKGNYITADIDEDKYKKNSFHRNIDITNISMESNSVDAIICSHVMEHVIDDRKAMRECFRVLKPGGWAIFMVPIRYDLKKTFEDFSVTDEKERLKLFGQWNHVRWYSTDFFDRLQSVGFNVKLFAANRFSKKDISRSALNFSWKLSKQDDIYFCRKP